MKAKGISVIACLSVNDPFVMEAWCKEQNGTDKIVMLSDVMGEFSKASHRAAIGNWHQLTHQSPANYPGDWWVVGG